jgi:lysozyme
VRFWTTVMALVAAVALAAAFAVGRGWWMPYPRAARRYETWGVDVSHHQGTIDWARVAATPRLRFAYVKATEGGDFVDPAFTRNWSEARRAGLRVGAYHFFNLCKPGAEQARHFLSVVPRAGPLPSPAPRGDGGPGTRDDLPPALDLELGPPCRRPPPRDVVAREVAAWLAEVERVDGRRPVLYVTHESYDLFLRGAEPPGPLWVRAILDEPALDPGHAWTVWQFWPRGRVAGIAGPVDLNVLR